MDSSSFTEAILPESKRDSTQSEITGFGTTFTKGPPSPKSKRDSTQSTMVDANSPPDLPYKDNVNPPHFHVKARMRVKR